MAVGDEVEAVLEAGERELGAADVGHGEVAGFDHLDGFGPGVGAEVGAEDVEFLVGADDAPVDRDRVFEDAVLDVGAEFAEDVEALGDGGGVAGAFDVDVGAVATGAGNAASNRRSALLAKFVCDPVAGTSWGRHDLRWPQVRGNS